MPSIGSMFEGRCEILARLGDSGFGRIDEGRQFSPGQALGLNALRFPVGPFADARIRIGPGVARFRRQERLRG